ncbi:MAG: hypothetical protein M3T55_08975, partial [Pseudomonadota bacterium]|nr:hypothetical protein [Pseudomonadota bacterium]
FQRNAGCGAMRLNAVATQTGSVTQASETTPGFLAGLAGGIFTSYRPPLAVQNRAAGSSGRKARM